MLLIHNTSILSSALRSKAFHRLALSARRGVEIRTMAAAAGEKDTYHVLKYDYVPDILERRDPYRAAHLEGASKMAAAGKLAMAGALAEPVDGALFIFRNCSVDEIEEFVKKDPYFGAGLITGHEIRPYVVVAGDSR